MEPKIFDPGVAFHTLNLMPCQIQPCEFGDTGLHSTKNGGDHIRKRQHIHRLHCIV